MKILNKFLTALLIAVIFVACDSKEKTAGQATEIEASDAESDVRTVHLDIEGMTCEIGCAKLIQSKLYKTEGVSFAEVHFADSSGVVSYDANRLSEKELIEAVEQAGGGGLYTVASIDRIESLDSKENLTTPTN